MKGSEAATGSGKIADWGRQKHSSVWEGKMEIALKQGREGTAMGVRGARGKTINKERRWKREAAENDGEEKWRNAEKCGGMEWCSSKEYPGRRRKVTMRWRGSKETARASKREEAVAASGRYG